MRQAVRRPSKRVLEADALPRDPAFVEALLARTRTLAARIAMQ